jgi:hypothetical protein
MPCEYEGGRKMSKGGWKIAVRSPRVAAPDVSKLSLPAQMICEAAEQFARAALNGVEVHLHYDESGERPFVTISAKTSRFTVAYVGTHLLISFEDERKTGASAFEYWKREIAIECDVNTARTIVSGTVTTLLVAVREGIVQLSPKLDSVFSSPPSE